MEFSRQEYLSGLPFPSPGDFSDSGIKPGSPALQADSLLSEPPGRIILSVFKQIFIISYTRNYAPTLGTHKCCRPSASQLNKCRIRNLCQMFVGCFLFLIYYLLGCSESKLQWDLHCVVQVFCCSAQTLSSCELCIESRVWGSVAVMPGISCSAACGILVPWPKIKFMYPTLQRMLIFHQNVSSLVKCVLKTLYPFCTELFYWDFRVFYENMHFANIFI